MAKLLSGITLSVRGGMAVSKETQSKWFFVSGLRVTTQIALRSAHGEDDDGGNEENKDDEDDACDGDKGDGLWWWWWWWRWYRF